MQVYDLSLPSRGTKNKLPGLSSWLNPHYPGPGKLLLDKTIPSGVKYHDPRNWKKDFPDHVYQFEELIEIKNKLNKAKQKIDPWNKDRKKALFYEKMVDLVRFHDLLRGPNGLLAQEYGAEIVTNAWLKMFELMIFLDPMLEKLAKKRQTTRGGKKANSPVTEDSESTESSATSEPTDARVLYSMHIAEAPGNFMLAINHYLRTNYPTLGWEWLANSYRDLYAPRNQDQADFIGAARYLPDQYGLIKQYPQNWIFGSDGDGDITSVANLRSFRQDVQKKFKGELHFMTSDVKYMPMDVNFDEEENINIPVHMGHLLTALMCLSPKGVMILKEFTFSESQSVSLLYLMANCFEQLLIVKPETSRPANSETYIVGIGYLNPLTEVQMERLLSIMQYIQSLNTEDGSPSIFLKSDIPAEFVDRVADLSRKLADTQIKHINRNVELAEKYYSSGQDLNKIYQKILEDMGSGREKAAQEWVKKMKIRILEEKYQISALKNEALIKKRQSKR